MLLKALGEELGVFSLFSHPFVVFLQAGELDRWNPHTQKKGKLFLAANEAFGARLALSLLKVLIPLPFRTLWLGAVEPRGTHLCAHPFDTC